MRYLAYSALGVVWMVATIALVFSVIGILVLIFSETWWDLIKRILVGMEREQKD